MHVALTVLGFIGRLILTWLVTELVRNLLSGIPFGILDLRMSRRLPEMARPALRGSARARQKEAHERAAKWSVPVSLGATVVTRLVFWKDGNFGWLSLVLPIALGFLVGVPVGAWAFRRGLERAFGRTTVNAGRPPADEESARAMIKSGIPWSARAVGRAQTDAALRQRIAKAVQLWDAFESLSGAAVSFDDLGKPEAMRRKLGDTMTIARRAADQDTIARQFDAALGEIAVEVAGAEGRTDLAGECQAALYHEFFDIAEKLGL